jgi:thiol-disulfide isomerase/thioredoxin
VFRTISLGLAAAIIAIICALIWTPPGDRPSRLGGSANFTPPQSVGPASEIRFVTADGRPHSLAEYAGRLVLVNFWATWCAPCVAELPSLERLQAKRGGERFAVLALSEDRQGWPVITPFLQKIGVRALPVYHDAGGETAVKLRIGAMPTTILFDGQGREVGRVVGPAEWDGPEAEALIARHIR